MRVIPYLSVSDAPKAIAFYAAALGAVEKVRLPGQGGKVMHAELELPGGAVFLSDMGGAATPSGVAVALTLDAPAEVDAAAARMAGAGATIHAGPLDAPWGDRFAEVRDPFGHTWLLDAPRTPPPA